MANNNYGIKVSMKGKAIDSTDPADYAIWSKYPSLKYLDINPAWPTTVNVPAGQPNAAYDVDHNLGYFPHRSCYFQDRNGKWSRIPAIGTDGVDLPTDDPTSASRAVVTLETVNKITVRIGTSWFGSSSEDYLVAHHIMLDQDK